MLEPDLSCAQSSGSKEEQRNRIHLCGISLFPRNCSPTAGMLSCSGFAKTSSSQLTGCLTPALGWAPCKLSHPSAAHGKGIEMGKGVRNCAVMSVTSIPWDLDGQTVHRYFFPPTFPVWLWHCRFLKSSESLSSVWNHSQPRKIPLHRHPGAVGRSVLRTARREAKFPTLVVAGRAPRVWHPQHPTEKSHPPTPQLSRQELGLHAAKGETPPCRISRVK